LTKYLRGKIAGRECANRRYRNEQTGWHAEPFGICWDVMNRVSGLTVRVKKAEEFYGESEKWNSAER